MTANRQDDLQRSSEVVEPVEGNYFVSAYPPFHHWKKEDTGTVRHLLEAAPHSTCDVRFGLYVHIPFCSHRCQFCYYRSYLANSRDEIDGYLDAVLDELAIYRGTSELADRKLDFVYFGGGTPSLLSAEQIDYLMRSIQKIFPWTEASEVTFECAPKTTTERKLAVLHEAGVTRISLGVQQLDDAVLKKNDRIHLVRDVECAYSAIQQVGFQTVNIDLMVGLVNETEQSFCKSLERVIEMQPNGVTIYQMEIPQNTPLYRALCDGSLESEPTKWVEICERFAEPLQRLARQACLIFNRHGVSLTRKGLLRVDRLIPEFYLSQHRNGRYE